MIKVIGESTVGLKELFRKEDKLLEAPQPIPELASESLNDESVAAAQAIEQETPEQKVVRPEQLSVEPVIQQSIPQPVPQVPQQTPVPQPVVQQSIPQPMHQMYPQMYGAPQMNYIHPTYPITQMPIQHFDISNTERAPLKRLLTELDHLEMKWHGLSTQKQGMEKELKYLETEIEHKLKLLRSHMAITNEANEVDDGHQFYLADGQVLYTRNDLVTIAKGMSQRIFDHHVGPGWNDFSKWAENSLKDKVLGKRLQGIKNPQELVSALQKY